MRNSVFEVKSWNKDLTEFEAEFFLKSVSFDFFRSAENTFRLMNHVANPPKKSPKSIRAFYRDLFVNTALSAGNQGSPALLKTFHRLIVGDEFGDYYFLHPDKAKICSEAENVDRFFHKIVQSFYYADQISDENKINRDKWSRAIKRMRYGLRLIEAPWD